MLVPRLACHVEQFLHVPVADTEGVELHSNLFEAVGCRTRIPPIAVAQFLGAWQARKKEFSFYFGLYIL